MPDGPAMLIDDQYGDPILYSYKDDINACEERHKMIYFIQCNLRMLCALYISKFHLNILPGQGFMSAKELFTSKQMHDVRHFIGEITVKKRW